MVKIKRVRRTTIHTNLTEEEFLALRKILLDQRLSVSQFFGEYARRYLAQFKTPSKSKPIEVAQESLA
jgi:intein-encoded DNA endonuclease-like protein